MNMTRRNTDLPDRSVRLLSGAANFRAVTALSSDEGLRLRAETLYRSGELSRLTAADLTCIATLGIRLVCDLRGAAERHRFATLWPQSAPCRSRNTGWGSREAWGAQRPHFVA